MPSPEPTELRSVAFDWKDLVLFAAGYVLVIAGLSAWDAVAGEPSRWATRGAILVGMVAPFVLRRAVFGWPALPPPKEGVGWSLLSMLAIWERQHSVHGRCGPAVRCTRPSSGAVDRASISALEPAGGARGPTTERMTSQSCVLEMEWCAFWLSSCSS